MPRAGAATARATACPTAVHALFARPLPDRTAAVALSLVPGIGPIRWRALLTRAAGDATQAARTHGVDPAAWATARRAAARYLDRTTDGAAADVIALVAGDAAYPSALLDLPDAPPVLWARGQLDALHVTPCVALVGTREHSAAGAHAARRLVGTLRGTGTCIVSGMARGIDGVVHDAALVAGLPTIAVLGTGADTPYPAQHRALYHRILAAGTVVSEHPPGTAAVPGAFPRRNRIIAALAGCTVVVEAGERSGALITANVALDLGRAVAAVPGPIDTPSSAGNNALLRDGAHVLASVEDLLPLLGFACPALATRDVGLDDSLPSAPARPPAVRPGPTLDGDEQLVWDALREPARDADTLADGLGVNARRCAIALAGLELRGLVTTELTGVVRRLTRP